MAYYLITARLKKGYYQQLKDKLNQGAFKHMRPFGQALSYSLKNARKHKDGTIVWEEEDYCNPPLKEEREAVLDDYFENIRYERVSQGEGWTKLKHLPRLFPGLTEEHT